MKIPKLSLTGVEKEVLFRKYKSLGLNSWDASEKVEQFDKSMKELVRKLKKKNKSDEHIKMKFKGEFEKLCQKLEI